MPANKFNVLQRENDSDEDASDEVKLSRVIIPKHENRLQSAYCLWFSKKDLEKGPQSYYENLQLIGTFATCEQFWSLYSHIVRPGDLTPQSDFHMFKKGIKPLWEDESNRYGGKWIVRLRKGLASRCWENLVLAILGEQFMVNDEICGAVISVRPREDILSVWNRTANDTIFINKIRDTFRRVLNLPQGTITEYKAHDSSLKDNTSFRNTDVLVR